MRKLVWCCLVLLLVFMGVVLVYADDLDSPPDSLEASSSVEEVEEASSDAEPASSEPASSEPASSEPSSSAPTLDSLSVDSLTVEADNVTIQVEGEPEAYALVNTPLEGGYYIDAVTSQLGNVRIYVPADYKSDSFSYSGDNVVSLRSATISGILYTSGNSYSVRWSSFASPQYRVSSTGSYANLTITKVVDTNVGIFSSDPGQAFPVDILYLVIILVIGVIGICLFMRL